MQEKETRMTIHIDKPTVIKAHGAPPKEISEFVGRVN